METRPATSELLEDPFFCIRKAERAPSQRMLNPQTTVVETAVGSPLVLQPPAPSSRNSLSSDDAPGASCEVACTLQLHLKMTVTLSYPCTSEIAAAAYLSNFKAICNCLMHSEPTSVPAARKRSISNSHPPQFLQLLSQSLLNLCKRKMPQ